MSTADIAAAIECLLFVAGEPLPIAEIARALKCDDLTAENGLRELQFRLGERDSGLQVVLIAGGWQLATRPEHAETIAMLMARGESRLSRAALETLAIIAYRQPGTQPEGEAVRGGSCGGGLTTVRRRRPIHG